MSYLNWSKPEEATPTKSEDDQPSVGANVAATTEATEASPDENHDKESKDSTEKKTRGSALSRAWPGRWTRGERNDVKPSEVVTRDSVGDADDAVRDDESNLSGSVRMDPDQTITTSDFKNVSPSTDTNTEADGVDRLKAALDDDVRRASQITNSSGSSEQSRRSVESLLKRAQRFFDAGRFGEARTAAEAAQSLGEKSQLEFAPDQERPADLVQRIDDHERALTEQSAADDPKTSDQTSSGRTQLTDSDPDGLSTGPQSTTGKSESAAAKADSTNPSGSKNGSSGRSWLWRDRSGGINPFRRERTDDRKPPVAKTPSTVTTASRVELGLELEKPLEDSSSNLAVVQANRGVEVGTETFAEDSGLTPSEPLPDGNKEDRTLRFSRERQDDEATSDDQNNDRPEHRKRLPKGLAGLFDDNVMSREEPPLADDASQPPVIDELDPTPSRRIAHRRSQSPQPVEEPHVPDGNLTLNFVIATLALAVCSYFALVCYRRGAT